MQWKSDDSEETRHSPADCLKKPDESYRPHTLQITDYHQAEPDNECRESTAEETPESLLLAPASLQSLFRPHGSEYFRIEAAFTDPTMRESSHAGG
jgi:hypothetical protein